jgi:hypothetical protein
MDMKCLRRMQGTSIRDRIRNEDIRKRTGATRVLNFKKKQVKWFVHVIRLPPNSLPQMAMLHYHCGKPCKRWAHEITEAVKDTIYVAHTKARSRDLLSTLTL